MLADRFEISQCTFGKREQFLEQDTSLKQFQHKHLDVEPLPPHPFLAALLCKLGRYWQMPQDQTEALGTLRTWLILADSALFLWRHCWRMEGLGLAS